MDLRKQLHDVLYARVLFTLVVLTAVLWVQIDDHGLLPEELGVALAVILLVNVPFFLLANRVETHTLTGAMVVVDILLVTAGVVYAGGHQEDVDDDHGSGERVGLDAGREEEDGGVDEQDH